MFCGGLGFILGLIVYFGWKDSENSTKRFIAKACAFWMIISAGVWIVALIGMN